jgi:alpha-1,2-mannosyltransferase
VQTAAKPLTWLVAVAAVVWHLLTFAAPPKIVGGAVKETEGRDFASYYYAARTAAMGGDPYDKMKLDALATADGTRSDVHPFFYPPPFLLTMAWAPSRTLSSAFDLWYLANEFFLLVAVAALWRWWRPLGTGFAPVLLVTVAAMSAIPYGASMGQANTLVLALVVVGLWAESEDLSWIGGALVGTAAILKMSPALFVILWLVQRRFRAAFAAVLAAVVMSISALPWVDVGTQVRFYTEILPQFSSGDYNGLVVEIGMFANHSVPNVLHQIWPSDGDGLSSTARIASSAFGVLLLVALAVAYHRRSSDPAASFAQVATVAAATLLVPVYTYEHHLVWALPAMVLASHAVLRGALGAGWAVPIGLAVAVLCYPVAQLKQLATGPLDGFDLPVLLLQEAKFAGLLVVTAATARLSAWR